MDKKGSPNKSSELKKSKSLERSKAQAKIKCLCTHETKELLFAFNEKHSVRMKRNIVIQHMNLIPNVKHRKYGILVWSSFFISSSLEITHEEKIFSE